MQAPYVHCAAVLSAVLVLIGSAGCSGTPDGQGRFAVPSFGGVPEQWEPDVTAAESDDSDAAY